MPEGGGEVRGSRDRGPRVAYTMSRFPKLSETFVLNEMIALEKLGAEVHVYPLLRERQAVTHAGVQGWVDRARYLPFLSPAILAANAHFVRREPRRYFGMVAEIVRHAWGSAHFLFGALAILPKSVRFAYELQRAGVEHLHAHFATHPAVAALVVHRLTGIPFSFTAHGSDVYVERRLLRQKVEAAAFVVTISRFIRDIIVRECGAAAAAKTHVVHCGVDPSFFGPAARRPADGGPVQIVCVAVLEEKKGHRFLVTACAELRRRGVDFRCHLVGDGPLRADVERRITEAGLEQHVVLHGARPRGEVAALVAGADLAVLASHPTRDGKQEGIPVALMEAMACSLPVVATLMSGIPELVEHETEGLLVPSGDAAALADALERLALDPGLRARLGGAARRKVLAEFDLHANARRLLELIDGQAAATTPEPPTTWEAMR